MIGTFFSEEYLKILKAEHKKRPWGSIGGMIAFRIQGICKKYKVSELLDYGSGHGSLRKAFEKNNVPLKVYEYDPGVKGKTHTPKPNKFVVCIDVLEHIEEEYVDNILDDLKRVTQDKLYITVDCEKAGKILADGRNAHITIKPLSWWRSKLEKRFKVIEAIDFNSVGKSGKNRGSFLLEKKQ